MNGPRDRSGGVEMLVQVGDIRLKSLEEVKGYIAWQAEDMILYDCYTPWPKPTEDFVRSHIQRYLNQIEKIGSQVTEEGLKNQLTGLHSYLKQELLSSKLLERIDAVAEGIITLVSGISPDSEKNMRDFFKISKERNPFKRKPSQ